MPRVSMTSHDGRFVGPQSQLCHAKQAINDVVRGVKAVVHQLPIALRAEPKL
jgi:hypothetical protein